MSQSFVRLKIEVESNFNLKTPCKLWYFLNMKQIKTIAEFRQDFIRKNFTQDLENRLVLIHLSVNNFDLPLFESTRLLRDSDLVKIQITDIEPKKVNLKRKLPNDLVNNEESLNKKALIDEEEEEWDIPISVPIKQTAQQSNIEACVIGSSMVKQIDVKKLFQNKNCLFKSISGGKITDIFTYLRLSEHELKNSKYFVITVGSNDCDSLDEINTVISNYFDLAQYLKQKYPDSNFIFNKLIPRTKCRYVSLLDFDKRRICFNNFLEATLTSSISNCKIVTHSAFESKTELTKLLSDGVHISPAGLPLYVEQIKKTIDNLI